MSEGAGAQIRAFLIADIRGYTVFTNERGDDAAGRLAARFAAVVREEVEPFDGHLLELRGDEALVVFTSPRQAIRAAVQLQGRCIDETLADPTLPLTVGIGLDAGEAVPVEGGWRGGALNLAARLCSKARAGEVLASQGILHLARRVEGIAYRDRGDLDLKGLDEPVRAYLVGPVGVDRSHLVAAHVPKPSHPTRRRPRVLIAAAVASALVAAAVVAITVTSGGKDLGGHASPTPSISAQASPSPSPPRAFVVGVERIDPATNEVDEGGVEIPSTDGIAVAGGFVWAGDNAPGLTKIAPDRMSAIGHVPYLLWLVGTEQALYADDPDAGLVRLDPETNRIRQLVPRGPRTEGLAGDGEVFWGIAFDTQTHYEPGLVRFDAQKGTRKLMTVPDPQPYICSFDGCLLDAVAVGEGAVWFVTQNRTLARLDPATGEVTPVPVSGALGVTVGLGDVWVIDSEENVVHRYDPDQGREVDKFTVGENPTAIAVGAGAVWVLNRDEGSVTRIDPSQGPVATIDVGAGPKDIVADDELGVWVLR